MTALVQVSKREPSRIALRMPSGIDTKYESNVIHSPSEIDTGSFSAINCKTPMSRK